MMITKEDNTRLRKCLEDESEFTGLSKKILFELFLSCYCYAYEAGKRDKELHEQDGKLEVFEGGLGI